MNCGINIKLVKLSNLMIIKIKINITITNRYTHTHTRAQKHIQIHWILMTIGEMEKQIFLLNTISKTFISYVFACFVFSLNFICTSQLNTISVALTAVVSNKICIIMADGGYECVQYAMQIFPFRPTKEIVEWLVDEQIVDIAWINFILQ